ncbi:hypothetical protein QQY79_03955 [Flavobacterium tructae]|uniref:DUF6602 domain-containing protein n=1 Tax=Flavobacterium tructae TaxID=1114873 RepID=UPI002551FA39|nr:DUF6602 domain-containing protein [Flavobacterium tructae]MDL2141663.1 hypothetical protein [Flavobacterium tructae]
MIKYPIDKINPGTRFIDLTQDYSNIKLITAYFDKTKENNLSIFWYNFPEDPTILELSNFTGEPFPDILCPKTEVKGRLKELQTIFLKAQKVINQYIFNSNFKKVKTNDLVDFFTKSFTLIQDEAEALIKLNIARGAFNFESQKGGDFIKLSEHIIEYENKKRFLQAIADEIVAKSSRIELLIQHSVTKGNYREEIFRGILKKYLPKKYEVATGFIEGCKRQCDILIYDSQNFSPLFREGDLVVLPEKAVRAVIEVKSTLDTNQLQDAMELLFEVARHRNTAAPIFKGIFAFRKDIENESTIVSNITKFYHSKDSFDINTNDILYLFETVNSICVLNEQCIITDLVDYELKDNSIRPRFYSIHSENKDLKPYCAAFFNELFSFLDVDKYAKKVNVNYFKSLDYDMKYELQGELYDSSWIPQSCFIGEHDFDLDSIWSRVSDVINWKVGNHTIQSLEEKYFCETFSLKDYKKGILPNK